jgi:hypothetical protein
LAGSIAAGQIPTGIITGTMIANTTITDANVSASAAIAGSKVTLATASVQGVGPALPNDGTKFLNGLGAYAAPPSAGQMILLNTLTASGAVMQDTTSFTNAYSSYVVMFKGIIPTTNATSCQLTVQSGGTLSDDRIFIDGIREH